MEYRVLSPWAEADESSKRGLQPRLKGLDGKTIGLFANLKQQSVIILREIERQLKEKFPTTKFSLFQYPKKLSVISDDPEYRESFIQWVQGVDAIISGYGDGSNTSMFLAKNMASAEKLGKPAIVVKDPVFMEAFQAGASMQNVPGLRFVITNINLDMSKMPSLEKLSEAIRPLISASLEDIIQALTRPLSAEEKSPTSKVIPTSGIVFKGDWEDVNNYFYKSGLAYGMPIAPPTEEAVKRMLEGTNLPPDYVVARLPPRLGKATVEKIAINAVMAGCLPTYMPLLIAGVQAMVDPKVKIVGYNSVESWFPVWIINGPIRKDLNIHSGAALMSPYHKPNATIGHALGLITMNIAGVRCGIEDNATIGHEARFGVCFAENEEESPWEPLHVYYGLNKEDNAVTNIWPNHRQKLAREKALGPEGAMVMLRNICDKIESVVYDPGSLLIAGPATAKALYEAGYTRTNILDYIVEYARRAQPDASPRHNIDNHLINPNGPILTLDPTRSCRKFWSKDHLCLVVAGLSGVWSYAGGGDHGGPVTKKVELPANWKKLVAKYKDIVPQYVRY